MSTFENLKITPPGVYVHFQKPQDYLSRGVLSTAKIIPSTSNDKKSRVIFLSG